MTQPLKERWFQWTPLGRSVAFVLATSSIWCLLAEFYGLCSMQAFTLFVSLPTLTLLAVMAGLDRSKGDGRLCRALLIGGTAGFVAAIAYDLFRVPFVFANEMGIERAIPSLPLFKVFPRFGAMILGQPVEQHSYSLAAQLIGWTYHFSNGVTFGMMYATCIDGQRRSWLWAVVMAVGLEVAMLLTPYPHFFAITVSAAFIAVTLLAHLVFGATLGLVFRAAAAPPLCAW